MLYREPVFKNKTKQTNKQTKNRARWHTPLIPALRRQRTQFAASLVYKMSSRTARAKQRNPVSKNKNKKQINKN